MKVWIPHPAGVELLGPLPAGVTVQPWTDLENPPGDPADVRFWVPPFLAGADATAMLDRLPALAVVQLLSAGADAWAGRVPAGVTLCDARGVHDAVHRRVGGHGDPRPAAGFPALARAQARREWAYDQVAPTDELAGKRVLIVGAGSIGAAVRARLAAVRRHLHPGRPDRPAGRAGCTRSTELPRLLPGGRRGGAAGAVHRARPGAWSTRTSWPRCRTGRCWSTPPGARWRTPRRWSRSWPRAGLRAALDVTDPEPLPADHPLWELPNVLLTPHVAGSVRGLLPRAYRLVGEQVRRFVAGTPLVNTVVDGY